MKTAATLICLSTLVLTATPVSSQDTVTEAVSGTWLMEDLYTVHAGEAGVEKIESHRIGAFVTEVEFRADGTGRQGDREFVWTYNQDEIQWRFEDGATVSLLVRFLTLDYFLVFARVLGHPQLGAAISGLSRLR